MVKGGASYNYEAARAMRLIGVAVTPIFALYALFISLGYFSTNHFVSTPVSMTISLLWVAVSIYY